MKNIFSKLLPVTILFLAFPFVSFAQVIINEIMYNSSGPDDDWVEIYNSGSDSVTITTGSGNGSWRFVDNAGSHILTSVQGVAELAAGAYAIITNDQIKFLDDWPYGGSIFRSSFSLTNTDNSISLKDGTGAVTDSAVSYNSDQGANGDGNSLQRAGTKWIYAVPTPGEANFTENASSDSSAGELTGSSAVSSGSQSSSGSATYVSSSNSKLEVASGGDRVTSVGSPIWFQATVKKNTASAGPQFDWSFGDGNVGAGPLVSHTYKYPGDYVVVLNATAGDMFSVSRFKVKASSADISILDEGEYLEIFNNGKTEINIFNWKIESGGRGFIFQPNTILLPNSSIKLDKSLLKMKGYDNSLGISLKNALGKEIFSASPVKEIDLNEASVSFADVGKADSAFNAQPAVALISEPVLLKEENEDMPREPAEGIIYEAPKNIGIFGRAWNFFIGVLR